MYQLKGLHVFVINVVANLRNVAKYICFFFYLFFYCKLFRISYVDLFSLKRFWFLLYRKNFAISFLCWQKLQYFALLCKAYDNFFFHVSLHFPREIIFPPISIFSTLSNMRHPQVFTTNPPSRHTHIEHPSPYIKYSYTRRLMYR